MSNPPANQATERNDKASTRASLNVLYRQRRLKDSLARYLVSLGGVSVLIAILLIFFYLLYVVAPLFESAEITEDTHFAAPGGGQTLYLGQEEQGELALRVSDAGRVIFFDTRSGAVSATFDLALPAAITSVSAEGNTLALGLADGSVKVVRYVFDTRYANDRRQLMPRLEFPLGEAPVRAEEDGAPGVAVDRLAFHIGEDSIGIVTADSRGQLVFSRYSREESFIDESITTELESTTRYTLSTPVTAMLLTPLLDHLYVALDAGQLLDFSLDSEGFAHAPVRHQLVGNITDMKFLPGGFALLAGLSNGLIQQWMPVRKQNIDTLTYIREFSISQSAVSRIAVEQQRKGFAAADESGRITLYYSTSERTLAHIQLASGKAQHMAWSARAENLIVLDDHDEVHQLAVDNHYPEVSWNVLWGKVWYEGYTEPDYVWQSSSSSNDFEPKLSLVPLSFGTIKAAIYAMLFAIPVAILGAIFTAQFMAPRMRQVVKPSIEIMEALPTVILGFLAGLWLAPYVEKHLIGVFVLLFTLPAGFILSAWCWRYMPATKRFDGWEALLLMPVILLLGWVSMQISIPLEEAFFGGDIRVYMSEHWGIGYDQRNALVVGLIMGFAVIPTIFSLAEDALFSVPQHLINGSLALGATRWQTLLNVVLPAASPGIFSGLMMGFGRAVGETMIVLMATGNTPVMDMSIFEGMRTLSANLAVEVPEAEVASTHYRVLFLAALVLFLFTFIFNTVAEIIRQRMRKRYNAL